MKSLDVESFSSNLHWREFEALAKFAFESFGYKVLSNYRLKRPRLEIDLIAHRDGRGFAVDCKHWKRTVGKSTMLNLSKDQIERVNRLLTREEFREICPLIVTWREEPVTILDTGVAVVPVAKLSDFLLNFDAYSQSLLLLT
ncbi:MAG TPA: restriction endonuclease, partial [Nitrososphaerales archaeon]|nr:restriction endonuclease [Nitrososphaerales archaeon]